MDDFEARHAGPASLKPAATGEISKTNAKRKTLERTLWMKFDLTVEMVL